MADVLPFTGSTTIPRSVRQILDSAPAGDLKYVLVIGLTKNDDWWFSTSSSDVGEILVALEKAKRMIVDQL
jgi:hypothetical protein